MVAFIFTVVATPPSQFWAFGVFAAFLVGVARLARIPARVILPRMLVEVPFVLFALLMPFFGSGPTVEVFGLTLSQAGLLAGWSILAKGTLGVVCSDPARCDDDRRGISFSDWTACGFRP